MCTFDWKGRAEKYILEIWQESSKKSVKVGLASKDDSLLQTDRQAIQMHQIDVCICKFFYNWHCLISISFIFSQCVFSNPLASFTHFLDLSHLYLSGWFPFHILFQTVIKDFHNPSMFSFKWKWKFWFMNLNTFH